MLQTVRMIAFNRNTQFSKIKSTHVGEIAVLDVRAFNRDNAMCQLLNLRDPFLHTAKARPWQTEIIFREVEELQVEV